MAHGELNIPELPKKKRKDVGALPPQAVALTVEVAPGGTVQIPLRVYGWRGRHVRYLLRSKPKQGEVSEIKGGENAVSTVVYRHTAPLTASMEGDLLDQFSYAAQDDNGTSAAAEVTIKIVEPPPAIAAPERISFGDVVVGSTLSRKIIIANRGGGVVGGEFEIDAPWKIEPSRYRLGRGEEAEFKVTFSPDSQQEYRGRLILPEPRPAMGIVLEAMAVDPFRIDPFELDLVGNKENFVRAGAFKVTNRTAKEQTLSIKADSRLKLPAEVLVPAGESVALEISLGEDDLAGIKTHVEFHDGQVVRKVRVSAPGAPARLAAVEKVSFGKVETGRVQELPLKVENRGGTTANVVASVPPAFQVSPDRFTLDPGQSVELAVTVSAAWPGTLSGPARIQTAGSVIEVPLSAEVVSRRAQAAASLPAAAKNPAAPVQDPQQKMSKSQSGQAGDPEVPAVEKVKVGRMTRSSVELEWASIADSGIDYRIEGRRLSLGADGFLKADWVPVPSVKLTKTAERVTALITGIPAGGAATMQVISLLPDGRVSKPSPPVFFSITPNPVFITYRNLLLVFFGMIFAVALWLRSGRAIFGWKL